MLSSGVDQMYFAAHTLFGCAQGELVLQTEEANCVKQGAARGNLLAIEPLKYYSVHSHKAHTS